MSKHITLAFLLCLTIAGHALASSLEDLEKAVIAQDFIKAKEMAAALLASDPTGDEAHQAKFYLGLSHLRLGEYEQAKKLFNELIQLPLDPQLKERSYMGLFNVYYLAEDYRQAQKIIDQLSELSPDSPFKSMIYLKQARVNLKLTNWSKAKEYLNKIINEFPHSMEVHTARQLLQEKQYFAVQVGAFLDRALAEKVMNELQKKGEYSYIIETTDKDGRTFYRVRVGQMTLLDDARQLKERLGKQGYPTEIYP
jgi:tetratricopeptide (TPR) repeat protein